MITYTIELRADFQEDEKHEALLAIAKASARELITTAQMLKDKRDPQIRLQVGDMYSKDRDVLILDPNEL